MKMDQSKHAAEGKLKDGVFREHYKDGTLACVSSRAKSSTTNKGDEAMKTIETTITGHKVVSREEWLEARKELLTKEKESTRLRDQLSAERRKLPWVKVEKHVRVRRT